MVLLLERDGLEGKVATITTEITPFEDEPEDTKDLKIQAELVARFQLAVDDAQAASEGSFENVVNHMRVLNPGVELNTSGMRVNYYVAAGQILVPDYLKDIIAQPTGGLAQLSPIVEGEAEG